MNAVDLILTLGRWGQTHPTEVLAGLVAVPLAPRRASLVLRGRAAGHHDARSARWATPREVRRAGLYGTAGRDPGAARRAAAV